MLGWVAVFVLFCTCECCLVSYRTSLCTGPRLRCFIYTCAGVCIKIVVVAVFSYHLLGNSRVIVTGLYVFHGEKLYKSQ